MTDNKSSAEQNNSENNVDKTILPKTTSAKPVTTKETITSAKAGVTSSKTAVKSSISKSTNVKTPLSKTALLAVVLSLLALGGIGAGYFWSMQQQQLFVEKITQNTLAQQQASQQKIQQLLTEQQKKAANNIQQMLDKVQSENQIKTTQLTASLARIAQKQPSDWLVHEAEYLIRMAARTMWLERDTTAAISLLKDANDRLKELDSPKYLPVRQLLHQDIEALQLMPVLETDEVLFTLMALNNQVNELPLAMVNLADVVDNGASLELSDSTGDWQENLQKTWQQFLNNFITVRRRSGSVEPLMSPQQQQHLKQNLSLKIQLAIWAASEGKDKIYQQSLSEIGQWLTDYFTIESDINQRFNQRITSVKTMLISYNYPTDLSSLTAIRLLLADESLAAKPLTKQTGAVAIPVQLPEPAPSAEPNQNASQAEIDSTAVKPAKKQQKKAVNNDNEGEL